MLSGVYSYVLPRNDWTIYVVNPDDPGEGIPSGVQVDAVIGRFAGVYGRAIERLNVPTVVTASGMTGYPHVPRVIIDNDLLGRTAAERLLPLGMKGFAYVGAPLPFSNARLQGFEDALAAAGHAVDVYPNGDSEAGWWEPQRKRVNLREWIKRLPKPVGIFCVRDIVALGVAEACKLERIDIPSQVALIGVDNDDLIGGMCDPPLTSIVVPAPEVGYRAAASLDAWLNGRPPAELITRISHAGVAERVSTRVSHVSDAIVQRAIDYIAAHLHEASPVDDIAAAVGLGRRTLERKFRTGLGRSVHDEIARHRIERAKQLLVDNELPLKAVARKSGFVTPERFFVVFRQHTGETPQAYRLKFRSGAAAF